jgi:rod shape-determining protein MreC
MPLGTLDRTPPPFFRQGVPALTKLALCAALAIFLMAADNRLQIVQPLRAALATALLPVQQALRVPVELAAGGGAYLQGLKRALQAEAQARQQLAAQSERAARTEQLAAENARLRALLELRPALPVRTISAEVMYEAADPYSRKLFIDRGERHGVVSGSPVVNEDGVLGQVTRVYPLHAVVTLLVDRDAAVPVFNARTRQRSVAFGGAVVDGRAGMELRFMAGNADVQAGDALGTSGIDAVYPPGLPVAGVVRVERQADTGFARILLVPAANPDLVRHVLVLEPLGQQRPLLQPEPEAASEPAPASRARVRTRRTP